MSTACQDFRQRLRVALEGSLRSEVSSLDSVRPLAWHEHLFTCHECRDLLEAEEALEHVLASMPAPTIPRELAQRLLLRLGTQRSAPELASGNVDLDSLLEIAQPIEIPADLSGRVLQKLHGERSAAAQHDLDVLLDALPEPVIPAGLSARTRRAVKLERSRSLDALLDLIPAPEVPANLAQGILATLEAERGAVPGVRGDTPILRPRFGAVRYAAAIAATLVVAFGAWRLTSNSQPTDPREAGREGVVQTQPETDSMGAGKGASPRNVVEVAGLENNQGTTPEPEALSAESLPDPSVLASLDVLEDWELLMSDDIDLLLGSLDESDAELLFLAAEDDELPTEEG